MSRYMEMSGFDDFVIDVDEGGSATAVTARGARKMSGINSRF